MNREPITDTSRLGMVELALHHMLNERGVTEYARARYGPAVATLDLVTEPALDDDYTIYYLITSEVARDGAGKPIDFDLTTDAWQTVLAAVVELVDWDEEADPFPPTFKYLHEDKVIANDVESEWDDLRWDEGWFTLSEDFSCTWKIGEIRELGYDIYKKETA